MQSKVVVKGKAMTTATLRAVGGSVMVSVPKQVLNHLGVTVGGTLNFRVVKDKVLVEKSGPSYSLEELLAKCDLSKVVSEDEKVWATMPNIGLEDYEYSEAGGDLGR